VHNGKAPDAQKVCMELQALDKHYAFVVDEQHTFQGSISLEKIALLVDGGTTCGLDSSVLKHIQPVPEDLPLDLVIGRLVDNEGPIPVVDSNGRYSGAISKGRLLTRLQGEFHE
jgi:glycine betaine/proline transport system ATP-binding protein